MGFLDFLSSAAKNKNAFDVVRVRTNLRMAVSRMRIHQNKVVNNVKVQRRQLAELMSSGRGTAARVKVEGVMREDRSIGGLEGLALLCELVVARVELLAPTGQQIKGSASSSKSSTSAGPSSGADGPMPELKEAVSTIVWAAARIGHQIPELAVVSAMLRDRFGAAFTEAAARNAEFAVAEAIIERLGSQGATAGVGDDSTDSVLPPSADCLAYLAAVAAEYNIAFDPEQCALPTMAAASTAKALPPGAKLPDGEVPNIDLSDLDLGPGTAGGGGNSNSDGSANNVPANKRGGAKNGDSSINAGFSTRCGIYVPPLPADPRDALEKRLVAICRQ